MVCHPQATLAVCCSKGIEYLQSEVNMHQVIVFWNVRQSNQPERVLLASQPLISFDINPNPEMVVAGCANGLVLLWDWSGAKVFIPILFRLLPFEPL